MVCGGLAARKAWLGGLYPESEPQEARVIRPSQAASRRTKMGTKAPSVYLVDKFTGEAAIVIDACW